MLCDFCHSKEASITVEQVDATGTHKKLNICLDCALKHGIRPDAKNMASSLFSLFKSFAKEKEMVDNQCCPVCGQSLKSIKKSLAVGCPECYEIFKSSITSLMTENKIKGPYTGSLPRRFASYRSILNDRTDLQNKLKESLEKEDYEKAALYRDYLKALEKSPVNNGNNGGNDLKELSNKE